MSEASDIISSFSNRFSNGMNTESVTKTLVTEEREKEEREKRETEQQRMERLEQEDLKKKQEEAEKKKPVAVDMAQNMEKHRGSSG